MNSSQDTSDGSDLVLTAELTDTRLLASILMSTVLPNCVGRLLSPRNGLPNISVQLSTIHITVTGLRVSSEEAKALQVVAFFQSGFFARYHCTEDAATFRIDLEILLVCLLVSFSRSHCSRNA